MTIFVFCGPTIRKSEALSILDAEYLPPAAQGDVMAVIARNPHAIGIIDGYFQLTPSVLHKEILWALDQGVHVFGSASMGALRAAELCDFGMKGIGRVFEDYRAGRITRDDEVALNHGPAELGYPALSEPLVNIKATLAAALENGVISQETAAAFEAHMSRTYFSHRSYCNMIVYGRQKGFDLKELARFEDWLDHGKVDVKKADAVEMLTFMKDFLKQNPGRFSSQFYLERTSVFDRVGQ